MILRHAIQPHRYLRRGEQYVLYLVDRVFDPVAGVPYQHVGMHGGLAAGQAQVDHAYAVGRGRVGAVAYAHHVAELAHNGADVALAELYQYVVLYRPERVHHVHHQAAHRVLQHHVVHALAPAGRVGAHAEGVDEVQLEAVQVPVAQRPHVGVYEVPAHLGIARVQRVRAQALYVFQRLALKRARRLRIAADEGNAVPQHVLHAQLVHGLYVRAHVGYLGGRGLPVAAVGIAARVVVGLPAVVHYHRVHAQRLGARAFGLDLGGVYALMEAVPAGIHGQARRLGHGHGRVALLPPFVHRAHRVLVAAVALVQPQRDAVRVQLAGGVQGYGYLD